MARHTHEFYVERVVDGEDEEFKLRVELEVEPFVRGRVGLMEDCYPSEGGRAQIDGPVLVVDQEDNTSVWDGVLTEDEITKVEEDAYEVWCERDIDDFNDDDDSLISRDYDEFHDDQVVYLGNGGKVFY